METLGSQSLHKLLEGFADKSAVAICIFAYCEGPQDEPKIFEGRTNVNQDNDFFISYLTTNNLRDGS